MKKILITGINGFLGSNISRLLKDDFEIIGLEKNKNNLFRIKGENWKLYFTDESELETIFKENKLYAIIHSATIYRKSSEPVEDLLNTNLILPIKLYELANTFGVELFLNTDSFFNDKRYHNYEYLTDYIMSKKHIIEWLSTLKKRTKIVNLKVFHMYGPGDSCNKFVSEMINRMKNNEDYIDLTFGEQKRDFIYVEDVANAFRTILKNNPVSDNVIDEYEVGTGLSISIKEFLEKIKEILNCNTELRFGKIPYRKNELMNSCSDKSKLGKLGWSPKFSIKDGLTKTIGKG